MELNCDSRMRIFLYKKKFIENPTFAVIINCVSRIYAHAWLAELFMEDKTAIKMCKPIPPLKLSGKKLTRKKIKVK